MPIKPENRAKYPKNWKEIRAKILERAESCFDPQLARETNEREGWAPRCECVGECGLHQTNPGPRRCIELHGHPAEWAKGDVVLTIAHLDHDPTNNDFGNLKAMCQRCHNRYDQPHRQKNAAKTRRERKATGDLMPHTAIEGEGRE